MASADVKEVLQLKLKLKESTEGPTLLKTLKKLQELDITLDILAETGIGKVVNSFRKHDAAGEVAKTLVHRWKQLVPKDSSNAQPPTQSPKDQSKPAVQQSGTEENCQAPESKSTSEKMPKKESSEGQKEKMVESKVKPTKDKTKGVIIGGKKDGSEKDSDLTHVSQTSKTSLQLKEKFTKDTHAEPTKSLKKVSDITNKHGSKKRERSSLKEDDSEERFCETKRKKDKKEKKRKEKTAEVSRDPQSDLEMPTMSFEAYLSYDNKAPKRKKRSCDGKSAKRFKTHQTGDMKVHSSTIKSNKSVTEAPTTMVSKESVLDLLKVPLPNISTECEDISQYQYFSKRKVEEKPEDICEEAPVFTGQRLNKKMQVYSGNKVVYLPSMMTLYQQCIRTLQNNIDSLYEIGGVPFEIVEPVLERCTPEQLLRIEECNPVYIGVTDHLWEKHCRRDFRNAKLEEYESWREMYLRLFEERERKLKRLTKSIVQAHSGKPKGRQVKMAFIHSAAKPPRNVRIQQEIFGTASPGLQHPADKPSGKNPESRGRPCFSEPSKPPTPSSGCSQSQDPRKIRRVAPMMAKSLKAFKKQLGRR